ncbi:MAG: glycine cleavage system aminomethyltransferase GcvT, partial [Candidatus Methylomirabilis sp.]|nr:glycine cleavage system aminomethyltransferase GcvT [Deltaproteobacteria bacterium]
MTETAEQPLLRTPLYKAHKALGAKMVPFGGWDMPVLYTGVIEEHECVREKVGLFDVSHMGEVEIKGGRALEVVQELTTNDASQMKSGQAQYSTMLKPDAGVIDDIIVYKISSNHFFICVNASNAAKDFAWMRERADGRADVIDSSEGYGLIAVQGPRAERLLAGLTKLELPKIAYYHFERGEVLGDVEAIVARTGYTGEDGFELFVPAARTERVWNALIEAGKEHGVQPCGLGARDTLRIEMKYALYGHELGPDINPLEAGLGWVVKFDKGNFIGRVALAKIKEEGPKRALVGFIMTDRG